MQLIWFLKVITKYIAPYKWLAIFIYARQILEAGFESGIGMSIKFIIDEAIVPKNYGLLALILLLLGGGAVIFGCVSVIGDSCAARFGALVINDIRLSLFKSVQSLSMEFFGRRSTGDIINCFLTDAEKIENGLVRGLAMTIFNLSHILFSGIFLFSLNWQLALLSCIGLILCTTVSKGVVRRATQEGYNLRQNEGHISSVVEENLLSQSVVKIFGLEQAVTNNFSTHLNDFKRVYIRAKFLSYLVRKVPSIAFLLVQIVILGISAAMTYFNWISVGVLASYQVLLMDLSSTISALTWVLPYVIDAVASMQRYNEILSEIPQIQDAADAVVLPRFNNEISFENVSFNYSKARGGIKNLSLKIRKGEFSVFVGSSGAGKSTIVYLLMRFYDPDSGCILIDGIDLHSITVGSLRSQIGLVSQDVILFNCSVRENIRMGELSATDEQVESAAKAAEIHDFILTLPHGYNTPVGERGGQLSGGQRQRIALARALVRNPAILILDEATSALDPVTEAGILTTLEQIASDRTVIVVTHRLNQAVHADKIVVLENGCIVATGSHSDLIQQQGLYATLWQQTNGGTNEGNINASKITRTFK